MILSDKKFNGGNIGSIQMWKYAMNPRNLKKMSAFSSLLSWIYHH